MRIMFIIPSLYGGGAERVVARLASALCTEHEVHIATLLPLNPDELYDHDPRVQLHDVEARSFGGHIAARLPVVRTLRRWHVLRNLKRRLHIQVAASFLTSCNEANVMSQAGERVVVSIRSILEKTIVKDRRRATIMRTSIRIAGRRSACTVTVSKNCAHEQVDVYGVDPRKIVTIYNPIDAPTLRAQAAEAPDDAAFKRFRSEHGTVVLTAGRLTHQKGQWHLIRALRRVRETHPDVGLVILGKGELQETLRKIVAANSLDDHVLLAGFHPSPFGYMGACDLFVMPSLFEGFSNALLEAMACGLPLVAADCNSGPRELLAPDTDSTIPTTKLDLAPYGILTPPLSDDLSLVDQPLEPAEQILADGIVALLDDPQLRAHYQELGAQRIEDFATARIVNQWCQALQVPAPQQQASDEALPERP